MPVHEVEHLYKQAATTALRVAACGLADIREYGPATPWMSVYGQTAVELIDMALRYRQALRRSEAPPCQL